MAWPFTTISAPNVDSGVVSLPASLTNVPNSPGAATTGWLLGIHLENTTGASVTVTLQDGNAAQVLSSMVLGANEVKILAWEFLPVVGVLQWSCSSASAVNAKLWGYV
jgi:hypothetical protein